jgi:hypothetical protein
MKKSAVVPLLALALLLIPAAPSLAWRGHPGVRTHVFVGVGPSFWWGPYWWHYPPPYYVYPPPYYAYPPPYYAYPPPQVIVESPPVYVQPEPPLQSPASAPQAYWYYCASARAYYPNVQTCSEAWVKVPPRTQ